MDARRQALGICDALERSDASRAAGRGGSQILVEDPSGNPVELFQPAG
jgi:hypothetical protein